MRLVRDILITIGLVALFVVGAEFSMRWIGLNYEASLYQNDPVLGYVLRPNAQGWSVGETDMFIRVSPQGLRDRAHSLARPKGVLRIAVLGDSYAAARQVRPEDAFWAVMERKLNDALKGTDTKVEVLNFGVDGYGLPQEYELLRTKVAQFDPQIILLTGNFHSLLLRCDRQLGTTSDSQGPVPYFVRRGDDLVLDDLSVQGRRAFVPPSRRDAIVADLTNASRVLSLLNEARRKAAEEWHSLKHSLEGIKEVSIAQAVNYEDRVMQGPGMGRQFDQAWDVFEELMRRSQRLATEQHAEFWLFLIDTPLQIDADTERREFRQDLLDIDDLFATDKIIDDFATREGIRHDDLAPKMLAFAEQHHVMLHGIQHGMYGHWNEQGHEVAGQLMAQRLLDCSEVIRAKRELVPDAAPPICNDHLSGQGN